MLSIVETTFLGATLSRLLTNLFGSLVATILDGQVKFRLKTLGDDNTFAINLVIRKISTI